MKKLLFVFAFAFLDLGTGYSQPAATAGEKGESTVVTKTPENHMPRNYFKEADDSKFDQVVAGMSREKVRLLCSGVKFGQFETIRDDRFAFGVDVYPSGVLALPGKIRLDREMDFFVSKERKRAIVVFFHEENVDGILVFDFSAGRWENRSSEDSETTFPAIRPVANKPSPKSVQSQP